MRVCAESLVTDVRRWRQEQSTPAIGNDQAELANQSLRDQFQIAVKFQMIFLCVAAAAAFHFEFTLVVNKSYYSAPTTLRSDQRCNPLLVGGCAVGPSEGAVQQSKRTKSEGKTHGPPTQVGQFGVDATSAPRACSRF